MKQCVCLGVAWRSQPDSGRFLRDSLETGWTGGLGRKSGKALSVPLESGDLCASLHV